MSDLRKAVREALDALDECLWLGDHPCRLRVSAAMTNLRAALAQPEVSPMSQPNRLIAYYAAAKLRELGYAWDESKEAWALAQPTADGPTREGGQAAPALAASDRGLPEPAYMAGSTGMLGQHCYTADQMLAFRAAGVAQERERCARVCEEVEDSAWALWKTTADPNEQGRSIGAQHCADAIRKG